jgi:hypothetical protein
MSGSRNRGAECDFTIFQDEIRRTLYAAVTCLAASVVFAASGEFQPLKVKTGSPGLLRIRSICPAALFCRLAIACALCFGLVASAASQSTATSRHFVHQFEALDHSVTFQYSYPMMLCQTNGKPGCKQDELSLCSTVDVITCLVYSGSEYARYNFRSAVFSLGTLPDTKVQAACADLPGTQAPTQTINGTLFHVSTDSEGAAGTYVTHHYFSAFSGGKCYTADLSIAIANYGAMDPAVVQKFTPADRAKVYSELRRALDTLHISKTTDRR